MESDRIWFAQSVDAVTEITTCEYRLSKKTRKWQQRVKQRKRNPPGSIPIRYVDLVETDAESGYFLYEYEKEDKIGLNSIGMEVSQQMLISHSFDEKGMIVSFLIDPDTFEDIASSMEYWRGDEQAEHDDDGGDEYDEWSAVEESESEDDGIDDARAAAQEPSATTKGSARGSGSRKRPLNYTLINKGNSPGARPGSKTAKAAFSIHSDAGLKKMILGSTLNKLTVPNFEGLFVWSGTFNEQKEK